MTTEKQVLVYQTTPGKVVQVREFLKELEANERFEVRFTSEENFVTFKGERDG